MSKLDSKYTYTEVLELLVSELTMHGLQHLGSILSAIDLIEEDIWGDVDLTEEERKKVFRILKESANKHKALIQFCSSERGKHHPNVK